MSSSVIRRNEQLTQLDDQFEKFMDQYDEDEVGALEMDDDIGKKNNKYALEKQNQFSVAESLKDFTYDILSTTINHNLQVDAKLKNRLS